MLGAVALASACGGTGKQVDSDTGVEDDPDTASDTDTDTDTGSSSNIDIDPANEKLQYVGRWNFDDPSLPWVAWPGASVTLQFEGTALEVTLDPGTRTEYFRTIVDGDSENSTRFEAESGVSSYTLVEGLDEGVHTVEMVKETYDGTNMVLHGFGLGDGVLLDPPEAKTRHIEFYGDSNLAGYSLMSEENKGPVKLQGAHFTFAGITARAFGADYHNIAGSGETLNSMAGLYDREDYYAAEPVWDFSDYSPDVVVMNLGANDIGAREVVVRERYVKMLDLLRAAHPDVPIVVFNAYGWDEDEPADYTDEVVEDYGDPNITAFAYPWVFEQWHGCESDHGGMARHLISHLETVLGWEASEPDMMSGFGWEGDLANGGFEEQAQFGGYGWRYYTDTGVERVQDASEAQEGDFYLQLSGGAEVHQPNPVTGGQVVTITAWMRGANDGDQALVTLDFRDQNMWSVPVDSTETTVDLTTDWVKHTFAGTAPDDSVMPVFHTRFTMAAASGTVEIDGLGMTTE